jgi:hypothetical protein
MLTDRIDSDVISPIIEGREGRGIRFILDPPPPPPLPFSLSQHPTLCKEWFQSKKRDFPRIYRPVLVAVAVVVAKGDLQLKRPESISAATGTGDQMKGRWLRN